MTLEERASALRSCAVFVNLSEELIARAAAAAEVVSAEPGASVIVEGERATELFVLMSGDLEVSRRTRDGDEVVIDRLHDERVLLGEMQALTGGRRTATVRAVTEATLLRLARAQLDELVDADPTTLARFADLSHDRVRRHQLQAALRIGDEDQDLLTAVHELVEWQQLERGDRLVEQGDASDAIYFLLRGRLETVVEDDAGTLKVLGGILPGESLGETAVLRQQTRAATVWAAGPSEVARMGRDDFLRLSQAHPSLLRRTLEVVVERQRRRSSRTRSGLNAHTIALVPLSERVPMRELVPTLMTELARLTTALHVDRRWVSERLGDDEIADLDAANPRTLRISMLMDELEGEVEHLVYEADRLDSGWTHRCLQMADEVILVGLAEDPPAPSELERRLTRVERDFLRPYTTLVLVHRKAATPSGTGAWLGRRDVNAVHHLRTGRPGDYARLARFCSGQAVGLVLSGGAARSLAGLGVLDAMTELGIPIDAVGGVSAGALVAAAWAASVPRETLIERLFSARSAFRMLELNLPIVSLSSARGFMTSLRGLFGSTCIEDLWLPCFCVSTNVTQARQRVSVRGDLCESLMATNSMPGVFPPVVIDGDLHIDGAFLNNVPIAEMARLVRGGPVVALDVTPTVEFQHNVEASQGLAGWRVLRDKLRGRGDHAAMPNLFELLMRSQLVHHVAHVREVRPLADLYLQPELDEFGLGQHYRARALARAGYEQTRGPLRDWWAAELARGRAPAQSR